MYIGSSTDCDQWYAWDATKSEDERLITKENATENEEVDQKKLTNGCGLNCDEYYALKKKMLKSIYQNGGFWIGRYEAGIDGKLNSEVVDTLDTAAATPRTSSSTSTSVNAVSQQNKYPYNYVTCSQAQELASQMPTSGGLTSSLMFGVQWNLVCKFLETEKSLNQSKIKSNSSSWGNYNNALFTINSGEYTSSPDKGYWTKCSGNTKKLIGSKLLTTGASTKNTDEIPEGRDRNCVLNIYDFAGNEWEWTLEMTTNPRSPCCSRGGSYANDGDKFRASDRSLEIPTATDSKYSFRVTLY